MRIKVTDDEWRDMQRRGYRCKAVLSTRDVQAMVEVHPAPVRRQSRAGSPRKRRGNRGAVELPADCDRALIKEAVLAGSIRPEQWASKTEARAAQWLEYQRLDGKISRLAYEPVTFRVTVNRRVRRYTPDFICILPDGGLRIIEIKGSRQRPRELDRLDLFIPHLPEFELWREFGRHDWRRMER